MKSKFFFTIEAAVVDPSKPPVGGVVESRSCEEVLFILLQKLRGLDSDDPRVPTILKGAKDFGTGKKLTVPSWDDEQVEVVLTVLPILNGTDLLPKPPTQGEIKFHQKAMEN